MMNVLQLILGIVLIFCGALLVANFHKSSRQQDDAFPVPPSRTIAHSDNDPAHSLKVLPGETIMAASCCEECGHVQKFWIEAVEE